MEKSFLSAYKQSSSLPLFALFNFFLIGFCRWVSSARIVLSRFFPLLQRVSDKTNKDLDFSNQKQQSLIKHTDQDQDDLTREEAEMVMKSLGLVPDSETNELQERYSSKEISSLFEEKEASLEEVKQAFDVFDENKDGFIDAIELQRVLTILGFKQGSYIENCLVMISSLDGNKEGRLDFNGFVKFMETSFY
ncbi:hypothetical protein AALP_AA5G058000 [Arabis alpina]|uniref:EF-hand domain-containing protein n=1 Tax=Arabis alpina TaxID=50452 RepID=A0A087GV69_ARAAL|nr:hypothetical protein AALP_AA5G058000 [Arabis alpina]